jgi:hypothetical protein
LAIADRETSDSRWMFENVDGGHVLADACPASLPAHVVAVLNVNEEHGLVFVMLPTATDLLDEDAWRVIRAELAAHRAGGRELWHVGSAGDFAIFSTFAAVVPAVADLDDLVWPDA